MPARAKRGAAARQIDILAKLRPLLRAPVDTDRMLRSVASRLAVEIGQYCVADVVDRRGALRRIVIEHADPSRRPRLDVACADAVLDPRGRVARLVDAGGNEIVRRVTNAVHARSLPDLSFLSGERVRSYMAATLPVDGAAFGVLSLAITSGTRRYDESDLALLVAIADWTGLGLENALRREAQPRASSAPELPTVQSDEEETTGVHRSPYVGRPGR